MAKKIFYMIEDVDRSFRRFFKDKTTLKKWAKDTLYQDYCVDFAFDKTGKLAFPKWLNSECEDGYIVIEECEFVEL